MGKTFSEEKMFLEETIEKFESIIEDTELRIDALPRMYRENPTLLKNLLSQFSNKLEMLKKTENKPYFARINFKDDENDVVDECYIGKVGVSDENNQIVTVDWRAPISSMYYDSNIGKASYEAPQGIITGELLVKRQYDIENKELKSFQDVDTVSNDDILKPYLGTSADNRLKNIVATIQSEQNEIIREKIYNDIIVQGVAGSGKTTVALHRIAYLVYNNMNRINPDQYLVIGPNKFFVNYISGVLPDLDVKSVNQLTYEEIVRDLLKEDFILLPDEDKLINSIENPDKLFFERLRLKMIYKNALDKFLTEYDKKIIPNEDLVIKGYEILPKSIISNIYEKISEDPVLNYDVISKKVERAHLMISKYIQDNYEKLVSKVSSQFHKKVENKSKSEIEKEKKNLSYVKKELSNNCNQSIKKYFSKSRPKILKLYIDFLKDINRYIKVDEFNLSECSKKTIKNLKAKSIEFEDLGALLYLYYRVYGCSNYENYRHAVIDEAQDFGEFNFYALKQIMPKCTFSIFGDLAQSIYHYRGIDSWERIIDTTFGENCNIKHLKKSYRTTTEIMNSANNITEHIGLSVAEPVIRHGVDVGYCDVNDNLTEYLIDIIVKYIEKGYSSIAVISKDKEESSRINNILNEKGILAKNISNADTKYQGGICTIPSYLSKGLEFDGVIITDASESKFNSDKLIDMKLLYVSMTRPLHELQVLYSGELTQPLKKELKKVR